MPDSEIIDLDGLVFKGLENYDDGDFNQATRFRYQQAGKLVQATFQGGGVRIGTMVGVVEEGGEVALVWQYASTRHTLHQGECRTKPSRRADGLVVLHERWSTHFPAKDAGTSAVIQCMQDATDEYSSVTRTETAP